MTIHKIAADALASLMTAAQTSLTKGAALASPRRQLAYKKGLCFFLAAMLLWAAPTGALAQSQFNPPRILSQSGQKFGRVTKPLPPPTGCRPDNRQIYGWRSRDPQGRIFNYALFPLTCPSSAQIPATVQIAGGRTVSSVYQLHITGPNTDPRNPEVITLYLSDFKELVGSTASSANAKGFFGDILGGLVDFFGDLVGLSKEVINFVKQVAKPVQSLIKDAKELWNVVHKIIEDAGQLSTLMMGKSKNADVMAPFLVEAAKSLQNPSLLPHQRLGQSLAAASAQNPQMVPLFNDAVRTFKARK